MSAARAARGTPPIDDRRGWTRRVLDAYVAAPRRNEGPLPMSDSPHDLLVESRLLDMLASHPRHVCDLALYLRREVATIASGCSELLYRTAAISTVFSYTGKLGQAFIHIAAYSAHVNLGFNRGARLPDPDGLLAGTGKLIRHVRIATPQDFEEIALQRLVRHAIEDGRALADANGGIAPQAIIDRSTPAQGRRVGRPGGPRRTR